MQPNFFLVGAPKCGTTALASYLRDHPQIFMTEPKEPYFLGEELRPFARILGINTESDYEDLYASANPRHHRIVGEASTLYLSSRSALANISHKYPEAKLVAMVRNPIDAAYAFHMQMFLTLHEPVSDFEHAWDLQESRAAGKELPDACKIPRLLQYREVAAFGTQLEHLFQIFDSKKVLVLPFDEFRTDTGKVYRRVLEFLDVPQDDRVSFPKVNESSMSRSQALTKFYTSSRIQKIRLLIKSALPSTAVNSLRPISRYLLRKQSERKILSPALRNRLKTEFSSEIAKMEALLKRNLPA